MSDSAEIPGIKTAIETPRLVLREMTPDDYPALAAILQDEPTMYAYEGAFSDEETLSWLYKQIARYKNDGFGLWAAVQKDNGAMIGQAGITWQEIDGARVLEIGYLFNRTRWGKGFATEAALACKHFALETLGADEIFSIVRDINIPSMNVAIRCGMFARKITVRRFRDVDMPHYVFSARKKD